MTAPALLQFFIPGIPRATQTGSSVRAGDVIYAKQRNTPWSAYCGLAAKQHRPPRLLEGALEVEIYYFLTRPQKPDHALPIKRPDVENLGKGILDSWKGILYKDDAIITDLIQRKRYVGRTSQHGLWVEFRRSTECLPAAMVVQLALEEPLRGLAAMRSGMQKAGLADVGA